MDVGAWLRNLGLGKYEPAFVENAIDFDVLPELTEDDLEKLGMPLGDRKRFVRAVKAMDGASSSRPSMSEVGHAEPMVAGERRHLTVMICDLVDSTALSARLDPEDMGAVIDAFQAACARITLAFDGFLADFRGDGILAYFGYPRAHEHDAERTVRAALDIAAAVARLKTPAEEQLSVRIGIATGLVVVGGLGDSALREHAVIGDTPSLAARLQALAEPGTVVVASSTRRLLGDLFRLRELGLHQVKGIAEPIAAWAVDGLSASRSRFKAIHAVALTDLIGREDELNFLLERQQLAWKGAGQIVLISGEPGIGKSRLVTALEMRIAEGPHTLLHYQCSPYHTNSTLYPFIAQLAEAVAFKADDSSDKRLDKLEAHLGSAAPHTRDTVPLFAALLSIPFGDRYPKLTPNPAQQRRRTFAALLDHFERLARQHPILLLFEHAQWADDISLELVDVIVGRVRQVQVLALFTVRPEFKPAWVGLPHVGILVLGRLDRNNVESIVTQVTGGRALPVEVMNQIVAKTDGNPLFVEELTKTVLEGDILVKDADGYRLDGPLPPLAIPTTLQDSLMARLDRLAPVKEIGQIGAVIGREFSYSLLHALVGRDETALKDALAQLEEAQLVFRRGDPPDAIYSFKHALVQDAAYENLLKSRRQVLHRRIAETLRDRFPTTAEIQPEVVAHHFTQAGLNEPAIEWWVKAGDRALDRSANDDAIADLEKAISLADGLTDGPAQRLLRLRLQTTYGHALLHGRGHSQPETIAAFARARELVPGIEDPTARFSAYYGMWLGSFVQADIAPMREVAVAALGDASHSTQFHGGGRAGHVFGVTCWFQGDYVGARASLEQALAAYDHERDYQLAPRFVFDDRVVATGWLAVVLWALGKVDQGARLLDNALGLARQSGHPPTIAWAHAYTCRFAGICRKPERARPHARELLILAREHGLPMRLADGSFFHGWARWCADDGNGESQMREGLGLWDEMQYRLFAPLTGTLLAEREAEARRVEAGLATLDRQVVAIEETGQHWFDAEVHRARGELLLKLPRPDVAAAESAFMRAIDIARSQQTRTFELRAALSLAKLYQTTSRDQAANELLVPALVGFDAGPEVPEVEEAQRFLRMHEPVAKRTGG